MNKLYSKNYKNFRIEFLNNITYLPSENLINYLVSILNNNTKRKMLINSDFIQNNISILRNMDMESYGTFIVQLISYEPSFFIKNHLLFYKDNSNLNSDFVIETLKYYTGNYSKFLGELDKNSVSLNKNKIFNDLIVTNKEEAIKNINFFANRNDKLLKFKKLLIKNNINTTFLNNKLDNSLDLIAQEAILNNKMYEGLLKREKIIDTVKIMISELCENENVKVHDIEEIGSGAFSTAYKIGNKVLKIGEKRTVFKMPNNKRFLKPLYRKEIPSLFGNNTILCIEITELVDTKSEITDDEMYEIYKEFRDQGYIWADIRKDNLGRLIRDNNIYFDGIDYVDREATSYFDDQEEVLKAGDIVIIDNDLILTLDQYEYFCSKNEKYKKYAEPFENRYQEEANKFKNKM